MTKHSNTLSETLLENSKITGVQLNKLSSEISDKGHGLFIESTASDRYIDLRLCQEKPFWGHSHPLLVQKKFNSIPPKENFKYSCSLSCKQVSELISQATDNDSIIIIDENFLFLSPKQQEEIALDIDCKSKDQKDFILIEKDLLLTDGDEISFFSKIDCTKIIGSSRIPLNLVINGDFRGLADSTNIAFHNAACNFIELILHGEQGKFQFDRKLIDRYNLERFGHYIRLKDLNKSIPDFLAVGILISELNFLTPNEVILCIPPSCTKTELLDTMERLSNLISE